MPRFPSREWTLEYCKALNENEAYRKSAKGWVWPILMIVENAPGYEGKKPGLLLKLNNGVCESAEFYEDASNVDAPFILSADYKVWLDIINGKLNPLTAIVRRKLKLVKGSYSTIMRYPIAALNMVATAKKVPIE